MRILVTGGHGQVGSEFEHLHVPDGTEVICLGRSELNIADADSIDRAFAVHKPDLLINAAAYTAVDMAESEPETAFETNEVAVGLLADACAAAEIPMFHISTDYVFDGQKTEPYTEEDAVNPISIYGKSKEAGERALRRRLEKHLILRTSWVFGSSGANFVKTIIRMARERDQLNVVDDQVGGPTSAHSVAECLLRLAFKYELETRLDWGTYHFSQHPFVSRSNYAREVLSVALDLGLISSPPRVQDVSSEEFRTKAARPNNSMLSSAKLHEKFCLKSECWKGDLAIYLLQHIAQSSRKKYKSC